MDCASCEPTNKSEKRWEISPQQQRLIRYFAGRDTLESILNGLSILKVMLIFII